MTFGLVAAPFAALTVATVFRPLFLETGALTARLILLAFSGSACGASAFSFAAAWAFLHGRPRPGSALIASGLSGAVAWVSGLWWLGRMWADV